MRVAITFRDQAEHKRCENEQGYSFFGRSEAEFLPHFIEFETVGLSNQVTNLSRWVQLTGNPLHKYPVRKQERLIRIATLRLGRGWLRDTPGTVRSQCRWQSRQEGQQLPSRREK